MTEIAAQVPALFEALSGMKLSELMTNVKSMAQRPNGAVSNGAATLEASLEAGNEAKPNGKR
jgi:flotillin